MQELLSNFGLDLEDLNPITTEIKRKTENPNQKKLAGTTRLELHPVADGIIRRVTIEGAPQLWESSK
jgi:hypothetical protein